MANNNPTPVWRNDRWIIQVQKNKVRHTFTSSNEGRKGKKECLDKYYEWLDGGSDGKKSLDRIYKEYMDDIRTRKGKNSPSLTSYRSYYDNYIPDKLKKMKMCKITVFEWQEVLNNAKKQNGEYLAKESLKALKIFISSLIRFGYEDYQCELPRKKLHLPNDRTPKKERKILTHDQVQSVFEFSDSFYANAVKFMILYGLRPSEVLGIMVSDIEGDVLTIQRGVTQRHTISEGKTKNAHRKIYLGELGKSIINETIERNKRMKLYTDFVFCANNGEMGYQSSLTKTYNILKKKTGLEGSPYSLRHTFASYFKTRMNIEEVQSIMGHSRNFDSIGTYGNHFVIEDAKKTTAVIDDTFKNIIKCNKSASSEN